MLKTILLKVDVENQIKSKFAEFCPTKQLKKVGQKSANFKSFISFFHINLIKMDFSEFFRTVSVYESR